VVINLLYSRSKLQTVFPSSVLATTCTSVTHGVDSITGAINLSVFSHTTRSRTASGRRRVDILGPDSASRCWSSSLSGLSASPSSTATVATGTAVGSDDRLQVSLNFLGAGVGLVDGAILGDFRVASNNSRHGGDGVGGVRCRAVSPRDGADSHIFSDGRLSLSLVFLGAGVGFTDDTLIGSLGHGGDSGVVGACSGAVSLRDSADSRIISGVGFNDGVILGDSRVVSIGSRHSGDGVDSSKTFTSLMRSE